MTTLSRMTRRPSWLSSSSIKTCYKLYGLALVKVTFFIPAQESIEEMAAEEEKENMEKKMMEEAIEATLAEKERLEAEKSKEKELLDKVCFEPVLLELLRMFRVLQALKLSLAETTPEQPVISEPCNEPDAADVTEAVTENVPSTSFF